jgi:hypothetical protein
MSRGIGRTQQAILDALPRQAGRGCTTTVLAERLHRSPRQVRTAVQALQERGLVAISKQVIWWKGDEHNPIPVYGALVLHIESYADWLEQQQRIRERHEGNIALQNLAELGIAWDFIPASDTERVRDRGLEYKRVLDSRLNRWIAAAVHCCSCHTCTCSCHEEDA